MPIEYLSGIQPGQKIDLGKFKDPVNFEWYRPELQKRLESMSTEVNKEYGQDFLSSDGRISLSGDGSEKDAAWVLSKEEAWAKESGLDFETWSKNKDKALGTTAEMAITVVLHELLGKDFIVARSSKYDDYTHGIDSVVIDKRSGKLICGFDDVLDNTGYGESEKKDKLGKIIEKGGAELKYAGTVKEGGLVRDSFKNVPSFYVSLSKLELSRLMEHIRNNKEIENTDEAMKIFKSILNSLALQSESSMGVSDGLKEASKEAVELLAKSYYKSYDKA